MSRLDTQDDAARLYQPADGEYGSPAYWQGFYDRLVESGELPGIAANEVKAARDAFEYRKTQPALVYWLTAEMQQSTNDQYSDFLQDYSTDRTDDDDIDEYHPYFIEEDDMQYVEDAGFTSAELEALREWTEDSAPMPAIAVPGGHAVDIRNSIEYGTNDALLTVYPDLAGTVYAACSVQPDVKTHRDTIIALIHDEGYKGLDNEFEQAKYHTPADHDRFLAQEKAKEAAIRDKKPSVDDYVAGLPTDLEGICERFGDHDDSKATTGTLGNMREREAAKGTETIQQKGERATGIADKQTKTPEKAAQVER
jgi:hypothetical protein